MGHNVAVSYQRTDQAAATWLLSAERVLSNDERRRRDRYVFNYDRRDFTAAHGLLRQSLSRYGPHAAGDWQFTTGKFGKPLLLPAQAGTPPLSFNLSHTHGLVACVVTRGADVGIDVERVERATAARDIAERYFTVSERLMLERCPPHVFPLRFIELWTLKEAYLKATGQGIGLGLDSIEFALAPDTSIGFHGPSSSDWQFWLIAVANDVRLAVALHEPTPHGDRRLTLDSALPCHEAAVVIGASLPHAGRDAKPT